MYEVTAKDEQFSADMSWIAAILTYHTFDSAEECARRYWAGEELEGQIEVLGQGRLKVVQRVNAIPDDIGP